MSLPNVDLLHEDRSFVIVAKPGGVLTQAPPGIDSMEVRVRRWLRERGGAQDRAYVGVPHRLDRPASGAMVFGATRKATRAIAEQFEGRLVEKTYWALVEGDVQPDCGTWNDFIRKIPGAARAEIVERIADDARSAVLHYRVRGRFTETTWLEIQLETGRTHQIRVQASSRGHAIVGDSFYGATTAFGPPTPDERERWIALHARILALRHPKTREPVSAIAPLPEPWLALGESQLAAADSRNDIAT